LLVVGRSEELKEQFIEKHVEGNYPDPILCIVLRETEEILRTLEIHAEI